MISFSCMRKTIKKNTLIKLSLKVCKQLKIIDSIKKIKTGDKHE